MRLFDYNVFPELIQVPLEILTPGNFNLFWHALSILDVETWEFLDFLFMIAGPVLTFFATSVLLPDPSDAEQDDIRGHYFNCSGQFFLLVGLLQIWTIAADLFLGNGFTLPSILNVAVAVLVFTLAVSKNPRIHAGGAVTGWFLFLVLEVLLMLEI